MSYQDEIEKIKYLRGRIASELALSGVYPDRGIVDSRMADIDSKLALFQHRNAQIGEAFDVKRFNTEMQNIYKDLLILYKLCYYFMAERYQQTKAYAETHLTELENLARRCQDRTELETGSTSIGCTIFYQGSGFSPYTSNYVSTLNLGKIKVNKGSKVSFFIEGRYFNQDMVEFHLGTVKGVPYSLNHDYVTIPGKPDYSAYEISYDEDKVHNSMFVLNDSSFTLNQKNRYIVYGGKNCISVNSGTVRYVKAETGSTVSLAGSGRVIMYLLNGSYVKFEFSHNPKSQNFSGYEARNLSDHAVITFEYENGMDFSFLTDGTVYAEQKEGIVKGEQLYYPELADLSTFLVEEYTGEDAQEYNLIVRIRQYSELPPLISMIAVKELTVYDEVVGK